MSNKRTTASRKRTLKDRRRELASTALNDWTDEGFGIVHGMGRADRVKLSWTIDHDPFLALMGFHRLGLILDALEVELVAHCRYRSGLSWDDIAWAREVTGEALRKRLGAQVDAMEPA